MPANPTDSTDVAWQSPDWQIQSLNLPAIALAPPSPEPGLVPGPVDWEEFRPAKLVSGPSQVPVPAAVYLQREITDLVGDMIQATPPSSTSVVITLAQEVVQGREDENSDEEAWASALADEASQADD